MSHGHLKFFLGIIRPGFTVVQHSRSSQIRVSYHYTIQMPVSAIDLKEVILYIHFTRVKIIFLSFLIVDGNVCTQWVWDSVGCQTLVSLYLPFNVILPFTKHVGNCHTNYKTRIKIQHCNSNIYYTIISKKKRKNWNLIFKNSLLFFLSKIKWNKKFLEIYPNCDGDECRLLRRRIRDAVFKKRFSFSWKGTSKIIFSSAVIKSELVLWIKFSD